MAKKRGVAYIRVSTKSDAQLHSFGYQESYWRDVISLSSEYEFCGIYADYGISGRSLQKRPELKRLIADAVKGKFDVIFTKSVARFGRNVEETLESVRKLRECGVRVIFEKEQIDTFDPNMEVYMTLAASIAENDLKIYSENMTWSIRERYKKGWISIGCQIYGYRMDKETNTLMIEPTEADTVRRIFELYEEGKGLVAISHILEKENRKNIDGKIEWDIGAIRYILSNEKYKGCSLMQKFVNQNGTCVKNDNIAPQWYIENTHEPIISPERYDAIQDLLELRKEARPKGQPPGVYAFAKKMECACCGRGYSHKFNNTNKTWRNEIWICSRQNTYGKARCSNTRIKDDVLKKLFVECYNEFVKDKRENGQVEALHKELAILLEEERELTALQVNRMIEIADFNAEMRIVREKVSKINKELQSYAILGADKAELLPIEEFDESKVYKFLDKAIVDNYTITFRFINGVEIKREYTNGHGGNTVGWRERRMERLRKEETENGNRK